MEAYTDFASVYDIFMDETPYEAWCDYIKDILKENGITEGLLLELGCGTGAMTELLSKAGFDMIGIDNSGEMLNIASKKREESGEDILYLLQDMREFELYGTVKAIVSICDSVNYVTEKEELIEVFRLVNNYLDPKGLFLFDFNTAYKYREVIGDTTIAENREDCSFIWDNFYYEEECINEYDLTIFVKDNLEKNTYHKFQETHYQRGYELEEMKEMLALAGMEFVCAYDDYTKEAVHAESERIFVVARERGK